MPQQAKKLSSAGNTLRGALTTYVAPRMASDEKLPDLRAILIGSPRTNLVTQLAGIASTLREATSGKLAQDADMEDVGELLEAVAKTIQAESDDDDGDGEDLDPNAALPMTEEEDENGEDDSPMIDRVREFCKGKMSPEDCAKLDEMLGETEATDTDPDDDTEGEDEDLDEEKKRMEARDRRARDRRARDRRARDGDMPKNAVTKEAMDAAIAAGVRAAQDRVEAKHAAIEAVRPYVGKLAQACDSADEVYRHALKALGIQGVDKIHPSAYPALLAAQPKPTARQANDAAIPAGTPAFSDFFADAARIRTSA